MFEGQRIAYTEYHPDPPGPAAVTPIRSSARTRAARSAERAEVEARTLILVHGLLLAQTMHAPLARALAARGNRVVTIDLLGHGESDRPRDMWRYSMRFFAEQIVALMDHLEVEQAVVMGTSLGANAALEIALESPRAPAGDGDRDAGARQRAAGERAHVHPDPGGADVRGAGDEAGGARRARDPARTAAPLRQRAARH